MALLVFWGSSKCTLGLQIHTMESTLKSNFKNEVFFKVEQMRAAAKSSL